MIKRTAPAAIPLIMIMMMAFLTGCGEEKNNPVQEKQASGPVQSEPQEDILQQDQQPVLQPDPQPEPNPEKKLMMFHNGMGPMCIEMLQQKARFKQLCPGLVIEEHLTTDNNERALMYRMQAMYGSSQGMSSNYGYLPISFINSHAYSGYDSWVDGKIEQDIKQVCD